MKRFTETEKWSDRWFRSLALDHKLAWLYLCDNCDHSGVWDPDLDLANFKIGATVLWEEFQKALGERLNILPNGKWHLTGFVSFQQRELTHNKPAHKQIFRLLQKHGIPIPLVSHTNEKPIPTSQGLVKVEGKGKGKGVSKIIQDPDAVKVLDKLNEKAGTHFRPVDSSLKLISERLKEGFTVEDCFGVIEAKVKSWSTESKTREWLNPHTLFRKEKFPEYVGQIGVNGSKPSGFIGWTDLKPLEEKI